MKYLMAAGAIAMFMLAGCGGGDNHGHGNDGHSHNSSGGHDHGDHGEAHAMGEHTFEGGYLVKVALLGEAEAGKEAAFEVALHKDGKADRGIPLLVWVGDKEGSIVSNVTGGEWMDDESLWDCHINMPEKLDGMMLWVRLRHDGKDQKHAFALPKD